MARTRLKAAFSGVILSPKPQNFAEATAVGEGHLVARALRLWRAYLEDNDKRRELESFTRLGHHLMLGHTRDHIRLDSAIKHWNYIAIECPNRRRLLWERSVRLRKERAARSIRVRAVLYGWYKRAQHAIHSKHGTDGLSGSPSQAAIGSVGPRTDLTADTNDRPRTARSSSETSDDYAGLTMGAAGRNTAHELEVMARVATIEASIEKVAAAAAAHRAELSAQIADIISVI